MLLGSCTAVILSMGCSGETDRVLPPGTPVVTESVVQGVRTTVFGDIQSSCLECELLLEPMVTLGRMEDPVLLRTDGLSLVRDSGGRTYVTAHRSRDHELILYDSDGSFVRTVGRPGEGPGELVAINDLWIGAGDTLFVLDHRRITVFDSAGSLARTIPLEHPGFSGARFMHVGPDEVLLNAWYRRPGLADHPFHRFDGSGRYFGSFGPPGTVAAPWAELGLVTHMLRLVDMDPWEGGLWVVEPGVGYRLDRLDPTSGDPRHIIGSESVGSGQMPPLLLTEQDVEAYLRANPPGRVSDSDRAARLSVRSETSTPEGPPQTSAITGIRMIENGMLLVLVSVPGRNWDQDRIEWDTRFPAEPRMLPGSRQHATDTAFDVIDVQSGALLVRSEQATGRYSIVNDGTVSRTWVTDQGLIRVEIYAPTVQLPDRVIRPSDRPAWACP